MHDRAGLWLHNHMPSPYQDQSQTHVCLTWRFCAGPYTQGAVDKKGCHATALNTSYMLMACCLTQALKTMIIAQVLVLHCFSSHQVIWRARLNEGILKCHLDAIEDDEYEDAVLKHLGA